MRFIIAMVAFLCACPGPVERPPIVNCTPYTTRCDGQRAELCTVSGRWELNMDCTTVTPREAGWRCDLAAARYTCVRTVP